jgi:hypothetical protein
MTNREMAAECGLGENSIKKRAGHIREHHGACSGRGLPTRRDLVLYLRWLRGME